MRDIKGDGDGVKYASEYCVLCYWVLFGGFVFVSLIEPYYFFFK